MNQWSLESSQCPFYLPMNIQLYMNTKVYCKDSIFLNSLGLHIFFSQEYQIQIREKYISNMNLPLNIFFPMYFGLKNHNIKDKKDNFLEILFYNRNQGNHKIAWGLGGGFLINYSSLSVKISPLLLLLAI